MDATIGIVTWRARELLKGCLDSIYTFTDGLSYEIIVVDNWSCDGTVEMVLEKYPHVILIQNKKNQGVASARNEILRLARARYVIVLDVDTVVHPNSLRNLVEIMDQNPQAVIGGPKLVYGDGKLQFSARTFPSLLNIMIEGTFLKDYFPNSGFVKKYTMENWDHRCLREVDWMYGACLIIRSSGLRTLGLFDEKFFYLYEDVDLCLRAKYLGMKVIYIPQATVTHFLERERRSIVSRTLFVHLRSIIRYLYKKYFYYRYKYKR